MTLQTQFHHTPRIRMHATVVFTFINGLLLILFPSTAFTLSDLSSVGSGCRFLSSALSPFRIPKTHRKKTSAQQSTKCSSAVSASKNGARYLARDTHSGHTKTLTVAQTLQHNVYPHRKKRPPKHGSAEHQERCTIPFCPTKCYEKRMRESTAPQKRHASKISTIQIMQKPHTTSNATQTPPV